MDQNENVQQLIARQSSWEKFSDEKTKKRIHKHISDANDADISEEDIKNVITDVNVIQSALKEDGEQSQEFTSSDSDKKEEASKEKNEESPEYKSDEGKKQTTPWDVLDA